MLDYLDFDRKLKVLSTTRGHFNALRALCAELDIKLDKVAWTVEMLAETFGKQRGLLKQIGGLQFRDLERRCMGLLPTDFKCLILKKPLNE